MAIQQMTEHPIRPQPLPTRIREFRKLRGMTLKVLSEKIDTTPQTVQRLEIGNMSVNTYWLEKIARALSVEPADLLAARTTREIPLIGRLDERGRIGRVEQAQASVFHLEILADDPVAARLESAIGPFEAASVLIANRFRKEDLDNAHGTDCLVAVADGPILLRRLIRGQNSGWILIPHENGGEIHYDRPIVWAARVLMAIRYY